MFTRTTGFRIFALGAAPLLAGLGLSLRAEAHWGSPVTALQWGANGTNNCGATYNGDSPLNAAKTRGGWYERNFAGHPNLSLDLGVNGPNVDITRRCPQTFNEYAHNHFHAVLSTKLASRDGEIYAVYDTVSGYHGGDRIKLQQNPRNILSINQSPYTILHLARNPRRYITLDHTMPEFKGREDCSDGQIGLNQLDANTYDSQYYAHYGVDQEYTYCGTPASVHTADPDLAIRDAYAFVTWLEQYEDNVYCDAPTWNGSAWIPNCDYGLTDNGDVLNNQTPRSARFPYDDRRKVYLEKVDARQLPGHVQLGGTYHSPMAAGAALSSATRDAFSPRVTVYLDGGVYKWFVAWAEKDAGGNPWLQYAFGNADDPSSITRMSDVAAIQSGVTVSSGRASGHKSMETALLDVATMKTNSAGLERPVIAYVTAQGALVAQRLSDGGSGLVAVGQSTLNVGTQGAEMPRLTTNKDGAPYLTWVSHGNDSFNYASVFVRRFNRQTGVWDQLGDGAWDSKTDPVAYISHPAIAVAENGTATDVYVSMAQERPSSNHPVGVKFVTVYSCRELFAPGNGAGAATYRCANTPQRVTDGSGGGTLGAGVVGVAQAEAIVAQNGTSGVYETRSWAPTAGVPGSPTLVPPPGPAGAGPTDLVIDGAQAWDNHPNSMWVGWVGAIQDHRNFDQGLWVKQFVPNSAERNPTFIGYFNSISVVWDDTVRRHVLSVIGNNGWGQLGTGDSNDVGVARRFDIGLDIQGVATGAFHTCVIGDGRVYCSGYNGHGEQGDGTTTPKTIFGGFPIREVGGVLAGKTVVKISAGAYHTCAVTSEGQIACWGYNGYGALGDGTSSDRWSPVWVNTSGTNDPNHGFVDVAASFFATCAIRGGNSLPAGPARPGDVYCWGMNLYGQLGNGFAGDAAGNAWLPTAANVSNVVSLASSTVAYHYCALTAAQRVFCWGRNDFGQLGNGSTVGGGDPVEITGAAGVAKAIAVGANNWPTESGNGAYLVATSGFYIWGSNDLGQIGNGVTSGPVATPVQIPSQVQATRVALGTDSAITTSSIYGDDREYSFAGSWGRNDHGQLGTGDKNNRTAPTPAQIGWYQHPVREQADYGNTLYQLVNRDAVYGPAASQVNLGYKFTISDADALTSTNNSLVTARVRELCGRFTGTTQLVLSKVDPSGTWPELARTQMLTGSANGWVCGGITPVMIDRSTSYAAWGTFATGTTQYNFTSPNVHLPQDMGLIQITESLWGAQSSSAPPQGPWGVPGGSTAGGFYNVDVGVEMNCLGDYNCNDGDSCTADICLGDGRCAHPPLAGCN